MAGRRWQFAVCRLRWNFILVPVSETRWGFFVERLLGVQPPAGYRITAFDPTPETRVERR